MKSDLRTKKITLSLVLAGIMASSSQALALDTASFVFHLPVLTYTDTIMGVAPKSGDSTKTKESGLATSDLSMHYVQATQGKASLYLFPFDVNNKTFSLSYLVTDNVEVGLDLGLNSLTLLIIVCLKPGNISCAACNLSIKSKEMALIQLFCLFLVCKQKFPHRKPKKIL